MFSEYECKYIHANKKLQLGFNVKSLYCNDYCGHSYWLFFFLFDIFPLDVCL